MRAPTLSPASMPTTPTARIAWSACCRWWCGMAWRPGPPAHSESALNRARAGYLQILDLVDRRTWPEPVRDLVRRVFKEDLASVDGALARGNAGATWRDIVRDGARE